MFKITARSLSVCVLCALIVTTWNPQPALPVRQNVQLDRQCVKPGLLLGRRR